MDLKMTGLTSAEIQSLRAKYGYNEFSRDKPKSIWFRVGAATRQPMFFLLLIAALVNFLIADIQDGLILFMFVIGVIAISIIQENRTEAAINSLKNFSAPHALVIRDSIKMELPSTEILPGDLVVVTEGDRVPADGIIIKQSELLVDESSFTGESVPVTKLIFNVHTASELPASGENSVWLFAGTLALKGTALMLVQAIGDKTEIGKINQTVAHIASTQTPLQIEINRLVRFIAAAGISAALLTTLIFAYTRNDWLSAVLVGISTSMALLPEEFPVVLTVFLAIGAWRLAKLNVLTRRSPVIETLGSATVVCVDKTGTLTENRMDVRLFDNFESTYELDDSTISDSHFELAKALCLASNPDSADPMDKAFLRLATSNKNLADNLATHKLTRHSAPSDSRLASVSEHLSSNGPTLSAKGAPETIARMCQLTPLQFEDLNTRVTELANAGLRVLAIAKSDSAVEQEADLNTVKFELVGLVGLHDPARAGVAESVSEFHKAGIRIVMVTGDFPGTALAVARDIGIDCGGGAMTGLELEALSDSELQNAVKNINVFARMLPIQKLKLIDALRANGEVVGMTGDGVNDAPALRAAHIGIAMGQRGTEVAREAAAIVLTDDSFTSIEHGIRQGRVINDNLRKAMVYIVAVHIPIFGMTIFPLSSNTWPLVLFPLQIAFLELIIDPVCSVAFESEPAEANVMRRRPRALDAKIFGRMEITVALLQGLSSLGAIAFIYLYSVQSEYSDLKTKTLTFVTLVLSNIFTIAVNRSWQLSVFETFRSKQNKIFNLIAMVAVSLLALITSVPLFADVFQLVPLNPQQWLLAITAAAIGVAWFEVFKRLKSKTGLRI